MLIALETWNVLVEYSRGAIGPVILGRERGGGMAAAVVVTQIYYDEEPKGFVWANIDEISSTRRSHA